MVVEGSAAREPVRLRISADEREQSGTGPCRQAILALDAHRPQDFVTFEPDDLARGEDVDTRMALESLDEVARHAGAQLRAPDHHRDTAPLVGQEDRGLSRRISPAHHHHRAAGALARLEFGGGVVDALGLELVYPIDVETPVACASRSDDCSTGHFRVVREFDDEMAGLSRSGRPPGTERSTAHRTSLLARIPAARVRNPKYPSGSRSSSRFSSSSRLDHPGPPCRPRASGALRRRRTRLQPAQLGLRRR